MLDGLTDYCLQTSVEAQSKALNISMQHLATLLDRVVTCCEGAGQTHRTSYNIQKCFNKNLTIFKLDPTPSNISQRVVIGWKKNVQHIALDNVERCCIEVLRAFGRALDNSTE